MADHDLNRWMRGVESEDPPELWTDISHRTPRRRPPRQIPKAVRYAGIALISVVVAAGIILPLKALLPLADRDKPGVGPAGVPATQQLPVIGPGQYLYTKVVNEYRDSDCEGTPVVGHNLVESWIGFDGSGRDLVHSWTLRGGEACGRTAPEQAPSDQSYPAGRYGPSDLSTLPTDPVALDAALRARSAPGGVSPVAAPATPTPAGSDPMYGKLWRAIDDLLSTPDMSPRLQSALMQVAAGIDGVKVTEGVADPAGRTARLIEFTSEEGIHRLYVDPETWLVLAQEELDAKTGGRWSLHEVLSMGITDSSDTRPAQDLLPDRSKEGASVDAAAAPWILFRREASTSSAVQHTSDLYRMSPDGSDVRAITGDGAEYRAASVSPEGTQLAYSRFVFADLPKPDSLWVANADDSGAREIFVPDASPQAIVQTSWAPDGSSIGFILVQRPTGPGSHSEAEDRYGLWAIGVDGSDPRQLTPRTDNVVSFSWSPDGTQLAYTVRSYDSGGREVDDIWVMNADGSNAKPIMQDGRSMDPVWSPDGSTIVFKTYEQSYMHQSLFLMSPEGSDIRRLTSAGDGTDGEATWSPDGTEVAFERVDLGGSSSGGTTCTLMSTPVSSMAESKPTTLISGAFSMSAGAEGCYSDPHWVG